MISSAEFRVSKQCRTLASIELTHEARIGALPARIEKTLKVDGEIPGGGASSGRPDAMGERHRLRDVARVPGWRGRRRRSV